MDTEPKVAGPLAMLRVIMVELTDVSDAERLSNLTEAVHVAEKLVAEHPHLDEVADDARYYAAWAHDELFARTGDKHHLDREIELLHAGVRAGQADMLEPLIDAHATRHGLGDTDQTTDLDIAIELQRHLLAATGAQKDRTRLGLLAAERLRASPPGDPGEPAHLDEAIELLGEAIDLVPHDDPDHPAIVGALGYLLVSSHLTPRVTPGTPGGSDLDRGIDLLTRVADADDHLADRLAFALEIRFGEHERAADRDAAIDILERLSAADPDYFDACAKDLGTLYLSRLGDTGDDHTFARTVACLEHAIRHGDPGNGEPQVYLVEAYARRWGRVPVEELDRLRPLCAEMSGRDAADPLWTILSLGIDAEAAIVSGAQESTGTGVHRFTELATDPHLDGPTRVTFLAVAAVLLARSHGAVPPDWSPFTELAIGPAPSHTLLTWLRRHRDTVPDGSPGRGVFAAGVALVADRAGAEFEERVAEIDAALASLPSAHPLIPLLLYARGLAYKNGADSSTPERLRTGIESLTAAAAGLHKDDAVRADCTGMLGNAFIQGYVGQVVDRTHVERAEVLLDEALSSPDLDDVFRATLLSTLGTVRGVSWLLDPDSCPMDSCERLHEQALSLLPGDHPVAAAMWMMMANFLLARSVVTRNLDDVARAEGFLRTAAALAEAAGDASPVTTDELDALRNAARLSSIAMDGTARPDDVPELDRVIAAMETNRDPDGADGGILAWARLARARAVGDTAEAMRQMVEAGNFGSGLPENVPFRNTLRSLTSAQAGSEAILHGDLVKLHGSIDEILRLATLPGTGIEEQARLRYLAGNLWSIAYSKTGDRAHLDHAITHLEPAYELATGTVEPFVMFAAERLTDAYWHRGGPGDADTAVRWGFTALREHARQVLAHEHLAHGTTKANAVVEHAHTLALRCASIGRLDRAVAAVESGRGLAMHAATSGNLVEAVLRELGHDDLAIEWAHHLRADAPTSNDLRYRVVGALAGTDAERRLLSPPTPDDVARSLRETGGDALIYLVPAAGNEPGRALVIDADGGLDVLPLPELSTSMGSPVDRYLTAHRLATTTYGDEQRAAVARWQAELGELLWWAWPTVVDPVLLKLECMVTGRTPRLVLVPCGPLGVVPWHAARTEDGGRSRFAVERAVFSYAASARQLCDVAARPARPIDDVAVVANPEEDLFGGTKETRYLHRFRYPDADFYGLLPAEVPEAGEGSPDDILALLPRRTSNGASLLHLACHAWTGPTPADSFLRLADGATLSVTEIMRHTRGRPKDAPGGLVLLPACGSDLADRDHDEALTVSTALLACGAATVVGTRWQVGDLPSSLMMCLFHRYLTVERLSPAEALRAAQLWALDRDGVLPADIASVFGTVTGIPLTTWAAFSHQGR